MSAPEVVITDSLRSWLSKNPPTQQVDELVAAWESGALTSKPATPPPGQRINRHARRCAQRMGRKWQLSPDRAASVRRRRQLGGSSSMPDTIRHHYTEGQRAALAVVSGEVKHHGICDLAIDRIAAVAGVSRTTVQNALREARALGHIRVDERPRRGQKNLTNLIRIVSSEWLVWLKRGPSLARSIGFKTIHPTKNQDNSSLSANVAARGECSRALDGRSAGRQRGKTSTLEQGAGPSGALKQSGNVWGPSPPRPHAGTGRPGISRTEVKLKDKAYLAKG